MDVRIAGIHMAVFRQAGRIAYYQIVANTHGIVGAYYYDFMVSGTESRTVFMDADDMAAGIAGMFTHYHHPPLKPPPQLEPPE